MAAQQLGLPDAPRLLTERGAGPEREVALVLPDHPYVGRGGLKLAHALDTFAIDVRGREALDIGASTGGFTDVLLQRGATRGLPAGELTLAQLLGQNGYATACIGKWHLGTEDYWPTTHGFDLNIAGAQKGSPPSYFSPYKIETLPDGDVVRHAADDVAELVVPVHVVVLDRLGLGDNQPAKTEDQKQQDTFGPAK